MKRQSIPEEALTLTLLVRGYVSCLKYALCPRGNHRQRTKRN